MIPELPYDSIHEPLSNSPSPSKGLSRPQSSKAEPGRSRPDELEDFEMWMKRLGWHKQENKMGITWFMDNQMGEMPGLMAHAMWQSLEAGLRRSIAAGLPEPYNRPHKFFDGGYTAEVTAYADGHDAGVAACRAVVLGEEA